jgi:flagellin
MALSLLNNISALNASLSQVTNLLNRAITIATEAATGTTGPAQFTALNNEYTQIKAEIDRIGSTTTFNGSSVFTTTTTSIFLSDASSQSAISFSTGVLDSGTLLLTGTSLSDNTTAATALTAINGAISTIADTRGMIGGSINRLTAATNVIQSQVLNLTAAQDMLTAANIPQETANLAKYSVLSQTGISALTQANSQLQNVLALFR